MHDKMWREVPMFMSLWGTSIQEGHKKMKLKDIMKIENVEERRRKTREWMDT